MFKNLTYKKKNQLLLAGAILFAVMMYSFAIKRTVVVYRECNVLEAQMKLAHDAPLKAAMLERKLAEMDHLPGEQQKGDVNVQQNLLGVITNYCQNNNVILREFPKTIQTEEKDLLVETNVFVIEGGFSKLLQFVYLLEQKNKIGRIASVQFQTKRDYKTKTLSLTAMIYVQSIKKSERDAMNTFKD